MQHVQTPIFSLKHGTLAPTRHIHEKRIHFYKRQTRLFSGWRRVAGHGTIKSEKNAETPDPQVVHQTRFSSAQAKQRTDQRGWVCLLKSSRLHPRETTNKDIKRVCEPRWTDHVEKPIGCAEAHTRMKKLRETPKAQKGNSREGKGPLYYLAC